MNGSKQSTSDGGCRVVLCTASSVVWLVRLGWASLSATALFGRHPPAYARAVNSVPLATSVTIGNNRGDLMTLLLCHLLHYCKYHTELHGRHDARPAANTTSTGVHKQCEKAAALLHHISCSLSQALPRLAQHVDCVVSLSVASFAEPSPNKSVSK